MRLHKDYVRSVSEKQSITEKIRTFLIVDQVQMVEVITSATTMSLSGLESQIVVGMVDEVEITVETRVLEDIVAEEIKAD